MHHTSGFRIGTVGSVANTVIPPIADSMLTIRNNAFFLPKDMRLLYGYFGSAAATGARFVTPDWRQISPKRLPVVGDAILPASPSLLSDFRSGPLTARMNQGIELQGTDSAGLGVAVGIIGLEVNNVPAPGGPVYTVRATGTTTATAGEWTNCDLTFDETLPPGRYSVVGLRAASTTGIAARIIFSGDFWRPGAMCTPTIDALPDPMFKAGNLGEWGQFENTVLPQVEFYCNAADTAQEVLFDIIKLS